MSEKSTTTHAVDATAPWLSRTPERLDVFQRGVATFFGAPLVVPTAVEIRRSDAHVVIIGVPSELGNAYRPGPSSGPRAVRDVSAQFRGPDYHLGVDLFESHGLVDGGDVAVVPANQQATQEAITETVGEILDADALPVMVGGEHSITIGGFRAFAERFAKRGRPVGLLSLDAHLDTGSDLDLTAATPITQAMRAGCDPARIAIVGVRGSLNPPDWLEGARLAGISVLGIDQVWAEGIEAVIGRALEAVTADGAALYVTFDFDSVDPAFAPGVVTPEPGGLTSRELLLAARAIGRRSPAMMDIAELAPIYDPSGITARLACSVITNVIGSMAPRREPGQTSASEEARDRERTRA